MKVQCDFCSAEAASVFCCADEAALCDGCDHRVHHANKLAGKHRRFSLIHPSDSSKQPLPLCDICQEKRGFLFCQEDRAILCRDCDVSIHTASDLTMKHSRFLLTGVKLSSTPIVSEVEEVGEVKQEKEVVFEEEEEEEATSSATAVSNGSSISEYLTKMLPGWHVEDFLIDDGAAMSAATDGFYGVGHVKQGEVNTGGFSQGFPMWVPRVPQIGNGRESNKRSRVSVCYW